MRFQITIRALPTGAKVTSVVDGPFVLTNCPSKRYHKDLLRRGANVFLAPAGKYTVTVEEAPARILTPEVSDGVSFSSAETRVLRDVFESVLYRPKNPSKALQLLVDRGLVTYKPEALAYILTTAGQSEAAKISNR